MCFSSLFFSRRARLELLLQKVFSGGNRCDPPSFPGNFLLTCLDTSDLVPSSKMEGFLHRLRMSCPYTRIVVTSYMLLFPGSAICLTPTSECQIWAGAHRINPINIGTENQFGFDPKTFYENKYCIIIRLIYRYYSKPISNELPPNIFSIF